jgi:hypothetical protein
MLTVHLGDVPVQAPPQLVNVALLVGVAVRVIVVPELKVALQLVPPFPQLIEAPVTRPAPVTVTFSGKVLEPPLNVATTVFAASKVTVQIVAAPVQAPLQPVKVAPAAGVAVRVAVEPAA